jgi:hypothetical protein
MIPITKDGKAVGVVSANFLVEIEGNVITTQEFINIFKNCKVKWIDLRLSHLTDDVYVKKAQILEWYI